MKVYVIEDGVDKGGEKYRYRSLITAVIGGWHYSIDDGEAWAERDGEQHQAIMERLYPQLRDDEARYRCKHCDEDIGRYLADFHTKTGHEWFEYICPKCGCTMIITIDKPTIFDIRETGKRK